VRYQENDAAVVDSFKRVAASSASGGSYDTAGNALNAAAVARPRFQVQFVGTRVTVYAVKAPTAGKAAVYLDNVLRTTVDLNSSFTLYRSVAYMSPVIPNGTHTVRIDVVGTSSGATSAVGIDSVSVS